MRMKTENKKLIFRNNQMGHNISKEQIIQKKVRKMEKH